MSKQRRIWGTVALIGFLLLLGTAGASDLSMIGLGRTAVQSIVGFIVFILGLYKGGFIQ